MTNTPLNPDGVWNAMDTLMAETDTDERATVWAHKVTTRVLEGYLAVAQPEVNSVELDRLPIGSIVLDATGTTRTYVASEHGAYYADCYGEDGVLELPARVLYRP